MRQSFAVNTEEIRECFIVLLWRDDKPPKNGVFVVVWCFHNKNTAFVTTLLEQKLLCIGISKHYGIAAFQHINYNTMHGIGIASDFGNFLCSLQCTLKSSYI